MQGLVCFLKKICFAACGKILITILILVSAASCGGDSKSGPTDPDNETVEVSITPARAVLAPGATQQYTAQVTGSSDKSVAWSVAGNQGSISAGGLYTAPANLNTDSLVATITAVSNADPAVSATANAVVRRASSTVRVTITPPTATIGPGDTQQFQADVSGTNNTSVNWSVSSGPGSISPAGLYSAPATISQDSIQVTVQAVSVEDPNAVGTASVKVKRAAVSSNGNGTMGITIPQQTYQGGEDAVSLGTQAVFLASELNGGQTLITTGTLTQTGNTFTYSATPTDRLRVVFTNGSTMEFIISAMNGDFSGDEDWFLQNDHQFVLQVIIPGSMDVQISTVFSGGSLQNTLNGTMTIEGVTYQANITEAGTVQFSINGSLAMFDRIEALTGSITGPDFSMTVNNHHWYYSIYNANDTSFAVNRTRDYNSTWNIGGVNYGAQNIRIKTALLNGWANDLNYWEAYGTIVENGVVIGQVDWGINPSNNMAEVWIDYANERVVLEQHRY